MKIVIKAGPNTGREHAIEGSTVVGRDPAGATLVVEDPEASRRHASLSPSDAGLVVEDLGSTNGTWVNGERIEGSREVAAGDEIRIGNTVLEVQSEVEATRMSAIPDSPPDDATVMGSPTPGPAVGEPAGAPPAVPEPPSAEPPPFEPAAPEPPSAEPPPFEPPAPEPAYGGPAEPPPPDYGTPEPAPAADWGAPPPPPPGAGQGYGAPQQAYDQPPAQYGQPGGAVAPYGGGGPMETRDPTRTWLLCALVPFYALIHFHTTNKEMEAWSGGRIQYNAGASICAFLFAGFTFGITAIVAISSYMGRVRMAQQMAGLPPKANFWGFIGRSFLLSYCWYWLTEQFNEIAVRQPQGW